MVHRGRHRVQTKGQGDPHAVTGLAAAAVRTSAQRAGVATIFVVGSTAAITTIEFEPGAISDLNAVLEGLSRRHAEHPHHSGWGDDNGSSHVRAALIGPSLAVPFVDGELGLGTGQQIMLRECDTPPRTRA